MDALGSSLVKLAASFPLNRLDLTAKRLQGGREYGDNAVTSLIHQRRLGGLQFVVRGFEGVIGLLLQPFEIAFLLGLSHLPELIVQLRGTRLMEIVQSTVQPTAEALEKFARPALQVIHSGG